MNILLIINIIFAYISGSISSAILICKLYNLPDPRINGSRNPGATNILRLHGEKIAIIVVIFDIFKGMLPIIIGNMLKTSSFGLCLISIAACIGHIYPIFFNFCGGKGVATALGTIIPISLEISIVILCVWIIITWKCRYASLGTIIAAITAIIYALILNPKYFLQITALSCIILLSHISNIKRLYKGTENKTKKL